MKPLIMPDTLFGRRQLTVSRKSTTESHQSWPLCNGTPSSCQLCQLCSLSVKFLKHYSMLQVPYRSSDESFTPFTTKLFSVKRHIAYHLKGLRLITTSEMSLCRECDHARLAQWLVLSLKLGPMATSIRLRQPRMTDRNDCGCCEPAWSVLGVDFNIDRISLGL